MISSLEHKFICVFFDLTFVSSSYLNESGAIHVISLTIYSQTMHVFSLQIPMESKTYHRWICKYINTILKIKLKLKLNITSFKPIKCSSSAEFLKLFKSCPIDVVICTGKCEHIGSVNYNQKCH